MENINFESISRQYAMNKLYTVKTIYVRRCQVIFLIVKDKGPNYINEMITVTWEFEYCLLFL